MTRTLTGVNSAVRPLATFAGWLALACLGSPSLVLPCVDTGTSDPGLVRIQVWIESAEGSASIDGDNWLFDNEADLRPEVSINGGPFVGGSYLDGDDKPHFGRMFEAEVPRALRPVPIRIRMRDKDSPDDDDSIDLDPAGDFQNVGADDPACTLELSFDSCCYSYTGSGDAYGNIGFLVWKAYFAGTVVNPVAGRILKTATTNLSSTTGGDQAEWE